MLRWAQDARTPLARLTLLLGISVFVGGLGVAFVAYRLSRDAVVQRLYASNMALARTLSRYAEELVQGHQQSRVDSALLEAWSSSGVSDLGRFLSFVQDDGRVALHTKHPDRRGVYVGHVRLTPNDTHGPTVHDLLKDRAGWVGENRSYAGERQLVAYNYSGTLRGLVGVHVPDDVLAGHLHATWVSWAAALLALVGAVVPAALGILYHAYATQHRARVAGEAERQRLSEELEQGHRLEAVGRLAGAIAHDFNNMLAVILMSAEDLGRRVVATELKAAVDAIVGASERAAELTRQLLAFSRRQKLAPTEVDVGEVLRDLQPLLTRLLNETVSLSMDVAPQLPPVLADRGSIEQVITNLLLNARDAMRQGGEISVVVAVVEPTATAAGSDAHDARWVRLRVRDAGTGMDEATRMRAFDPFFTTKGEAGGTGLGLATVHGIVRQYGGRVRIESAPGLGTVVDVDLPALRESDSRAPKPKSLPPPVSGEAFRIMVVEDDPVIRESIVGALRASGHHVHGASDGVEALRWFTDHSDDHVDLLLTDVAMPRMNGIQLVRKLAEQGYTHEVLFMSGYAAESDAGVEQTPADRFLQKPFSMRKLEQTIRKVLARRVSQHS